MQRFNMGRIGKGEVAKAPDPPVSRAGPVEPSLAPLETREFHRLRQFGRSGLQYVASVLLLIAALGVWDWISRRELVSRVLLPAPAEVYEDLKALLSSSFLWPHVLTTVEETVAGFAIASASAFSLAVLISNTRFLKGMLYPYIVTFQVLPKVALAPLFLAWLGFGLSSKIGMAAAISFFPVLVNTVAGFESVSEESRLLMQSLVATRRQIFYRLSLPSSLPYVFAGLKASLTLALIGAIVAEFQGARLGLAVLIHSYSFEFKIARVFAVLVILAAVGLVMYGLMAYLERRVVFWKGQTR